MRDKSPLSRFDEKTARAAFDHRQSPFLAWVDVWLADTEVDKATRLDAVRSTIAVLDQKVRLTDA